jgi:hypothetical protein
MGVVQMVKTIIQGCPVLLDDSIVETIHDMSWHKELRHDGPHLYHSVWNKGSPRKVSMEQFICGCSKGEKVIHLDKNIYNMQKTSLKRIGGVV